MAGQCQQLGVVAHKDAGHIGDDQHGEGSHEDGHHADEAETLGVKVVQLGVVACAVVVADDGGAADGIAYEDGHKQERRIHDDAISRDAVFAGKAEELVIVKNVDQRHGKVGHQLRGAVDAGAADDAAVPLGAAQMDRAGGALIEEVEHRQHAAHGLADEGGDGCALHAAVEHTHQHDVQYHVGKARRHREGEAQMGLFGGDEEALEQILQNEEGQADHQEAAITDGVIQHLALCAQQRRRRADDENADSGEDDAREEGRPDEEAEIAVGLFPVALAQRDAHDSAAAGAKHEAHRAHQHRHRHDKVYRRKSRFAHKVRDAQAVHDAVDGGEQHGADAGQHEPQKAAVIKVVG